MSRSPLNGVRILDLSRLLPGPVATLHLADLGADVIKIEDTGAGDYARTMGAGPDGVSWFYRAVNRNKRGLRLDLKQAAGREVHKLSAEYPHLPLCWHEKFLQLNHKNNCLLLP